MKVIRPILIIISLGFTLLKNLHRPIVQGKHPQIFTAVDAIYTYTHVYSEPKLCGIVWSPWESTAFLPTIKPINKQQRKKQVTANGYG